MTYVEKEKRYGRFLVVLEGTLRWDSWVYEVSLLEERCAQYNEIRQQMYDDIGKAKKCFYRYCSQARNYG